MKEIWKDIEVKGFEGLYKISNLGRVWSIRKKIYRKTRPNIDGYITVDLWNKGKSRDMRVHRLVALAFIPNPNNYPIVDHIDNNPSNPRVDNLQWFTSSMNMKKAFASGRKKAASGEDCAQSKLSELEVIEIIKRLNSGEPIYKIVSDYAVTRGLIYKIINGLAWAHVTKKYPCTIVTKKLNKKTDAKKASAIKSMLNRGTTVSKIAKKIGVSVSNVYDIRSGKTYREIAPQLVRG